MRTQGAVVLTGSYGHRKGYGTVLGDKTRSPQRLVEIYDELFAYNTNRRGLVEDDAARDASAQAILLADYLGGAVVYLPRGDGLRKAVRDSEAYRRHNGRNTEELAREYDMTTTEFYELIAREKQRRLRKMQGRLFTDRSQAH